MWEVQEGKPSWGPASDSAAGPGSPNDSEASLFKSLYTKCVCMGQVQIYSRLDQEAQKSLQDYRISIGLPGIGEFQRPPKIEQIGAWVDALAYEKLRRPWDIFVTGTFRPIVRRWRNPRGFAAIETSVREPSLTSLQARDFTERLSSHSPSEEYIRRFFDEWIQRLSDGLSTRVDFFVGFEAGRVSGANHFHSLLAAEGLREQMTLEGELLLRAREARKSVQEFVLNEELLLWGYLYRTAGRSLILPFDPGRGAGWYIAAAYVGKKQLGWDISVGDQARIPRQPKNGGAVDVAKSASLTRDSYHMTLTRWHR